VKSELNPLRKLTPGSAKAYAGVITPGSDSGFGIRDSIKLLDDLYQLWHRGPSDGATQLLDAR
jgi:hypothetical protein